MRHSDFDADGAPLSSRRSRCPTWVECGGRRRPPIVVRGIRNGTCHPRRPVRVRHAVGARAPCAEHGRRAHAQAADGSAGMLMRNPDLMLSRRRPLPRTWTARGRCRSPDITNPNAADDRNAAVEPNAAVARSACLRVQGPLGARLPLSRACAEAEDHHAAFDRKCRTGQNRSDVLRGGPVPVQPPAGANRNRYCV